MIGMLGRILRERARARAVAKLAGANNSSDVDSHRLVERAATAFAADMALLTLLRNKQLLVHASTGLEIACAPRQHSFCTHAVDKGGKIFEVCDATVDPVLRTLPGVIGDPNIRYYIGAPLTLTSGLELGMLCVLDTKPRLPASKDQRAYLSGLARQAAAALEREVHLRQAVAA